jgi:hypothetical protein
MKTPEDSPIKVYCTVDRSLIIDTPSGAFCTKCQTPLQDLNSAATTSFSGEFKCGIIRAIGVSTIASTLALAACSKGNESKTRAERDQCGEWVGLVTLPTGNYPTAKYAAGSNERVISPYTGKEIDVSGLSPGSLVMDPDYVSKDQKYFRIPEHSDAKPHDQAKEK